MPTRLLLLVLIAASASAADPYIFHASASARPGDAINVQGSFGTGATAWLSVGTSTNAIALPTLVQSNGHITARLPTNIGLDLYQLWVQDGGARSRSMWINRARGMHFDSPEAGPGTSLRIFGRDLTLAGGATSVRFVPRGQTASTDAIVDQIRSTAYALTITAPSNLQPGTTYDVHVSNGRGGAAGETRVERSVLAIAAGTDYFQLGVPWAAKLNFHGNVYNVKTDGRLSLKAVGDGVANDYAAIQQAVDRASAAGGGIVYLPAGQYKMVLSASGGLYMRDRVVLQGAGKGQTFLRYGYGQGGDGRWCMIWGGKQNGLADLTMSNADTTGQFYNTMTGQGTELFLKRITWEINRGSWLWLANSDKMVVADSGFIQGVDDIAGYHGPVQFNGCKNVVMQRNNFTYAVDGLNMGHVRDSVIENNNIYRDGAARWPVSLNLCNHVLILNFAENVAVTGNLFKVINGPSQNINDGESIISEGGGPDRVDEDRGIVSSATATTVVDTSKNWGAYRMRPVVAIVHGTGMGQWRSITSRSGGTLNVDRAWDVIPTAGSRYAIFNWGSRNWLVQGNRFEGNRRGITLYQNATLDVAIVGNNLLNSGSIDLSPWQQATAYGDRSNHLVPMYDVQIIGNTVANTDNSNGAFIGVHTVQPKDPRTFGTSVIGIEMRGNTLTAGIPNVPAVVDANFPEGFLNDVLYQPLGSNYIDEGIPGVLGTIIQDNHAINTAYAVHLNTASYDTVIIDMRRTNAPNALKDHAFPGVSHASVRTVTITGTTVPANQAPAVQVTSPTAGTTVTAGTTLTVQANASDADGAISTVECLIDGVVIGQRTVAPWTWTHTATSGTHTVWARATDDRGAITTSTAISFSASAPTTSPTQPTQPVAGVIAINAGGGAWTAPDGTVYSADQYVTGGSTYAISATAIANTDGDALYHSERFGACTYAIPVANGSYSLRLQFAELYWTAPGQRVFDVLVEGQQRIADLDIVARVGARAALEIVVPVTVADGSLTISLRTDVDNATIAGIVVLPATAPPTTAETVQTPVAGIIAINAGGPAYTAPNGTPYRADQYVTGGGTYAIAATAIAGTEADPLYCSERNGACTYAIPVANGSYTLRLQFAEIHWTAPGKRVFDVLVEGQERIANLDIFAKVGGRAAYDEVLPLTVAHGSLTITLRSDIDNAKLSGIVVSPATAVTSGPTVSSFTLINAVTNLPVPGHDPMTPGAVIDTSAIGTTQLNLRANATGAVRVNFGLDGNGAYATEGTAPYALAHDDAGDYRAWDLGAGGHTVTATPVSATGTVGPAATISFTLVVAPVGAG
ncbi:MAG: hypothetical protein H0W72_00220 [Planctomycetes bacterium]|nr:hypothetical protein [Planctomycetota bacterium]